VSEEKKLRERDTERERDAETDSGNPPWIGNVATAIGVL